MTRSPNKPLTGTRRSPRLDTMTIHYCSCMMASSYNSMVLASNEVNSLYNFLAAVSTWFLLAGFFILPGTFSILQNITLLKEAKETPINRLISLNKALIPIAVVCFVVGSMGTTWLWFKFRGNYVWLLTHLFLPGFLNAISCLFTILINVYTAQHGSWTLSAQISMAIVSFCMCTMAVSFCVYQFCCLHRLRQRQQRPLPP